MSATLVDFRVTEEMAAAVLKEVGALEPAERIQDAPSLTQFMGEALQGLEKLWADLRVLLKNGVSPSAAAARGTILVRSANLIGSSLELLARENPALEEFKVANLDRLQRIKLHAASLRRLAAMPTPTPDKERLRMSLEQMGRGEGIGADEFLAEFKG